MGQSQTAQAQKMAKLTHLMGQLKIFTIQNFAKKYEETRREYSTNWGEIKIYRKLPNINDPDIDLFSEVMLKEYTFEHKNDYIAFLKGCILRYNMFHRVRSHLVGETGCSEVSLEKFQKNFGVSTLQELEEVLGVELRELWTEQELEN